MESLLPLQLFEFSLVSLFLNVFLKVLRWETQEGWTSKWEIYKDSVFKSQLSAKSLSLFFLEKLQFFLGAIITSESGNCRFIKFEERTCFEDEKMVV